MKIRYKRSGGIANIVRRVEIDSSQLPEHLQAFLINLPSMTLPQPLFSDDFFHELELDDGRFIRCTDSQCPPDLLELFEFLTQSR